MLGIVQKRKFTNTACTYDYCRDFIDNISKENNYDFIGDISQRTCNFDPSNDDPKLGLDNTVYKPDEAVSEKKLKCIQKCTENGKNFT